MSEFLGTLDTPQHLTPDGSVQDQSLLNEWLDPSWTGRLFSLTLVNYHIDATTVQLIQRHRSSLRHLSIRLPNAEPSVSLPPLNFVRFRHCKPHPAECHPVRL